MVGAQAAVGRDGGPGTGRQIIALLGAMGFYAMHLLGASALSAYACLVESAWPIHALTAVALAGITACGLLAGRVFRSGDGDGPGDEAERERRRFIGLVGTLLSVLAFAIVVFHDVPAWFLPPCVP